MTFQLSEIGRAGQDVDVLHGGDVGLDGRLLTYHEMREALRIYNSMKANAGHQQAVLADSPMPVKPTSTSDPSLAEQIQIVWDRIHQLIRRRPWDTETLRQIELDRNWLASHGVAVPNLSREPTADVPAEVAEPRGEQISEGGPADNPERPMAGGQATHSNPRPAVPPAQPESSAGGGNQGASDRRDSKASLVLPPLPHGFSRRGAAAVWARIASRTAAAPRAVFLSASGGVGVSTLTAAVGGFVAAGRGEDAPTAGVEVGWRVAPSLTRIICGETAAPVPVNDAPPDALTLLGYAPIGPSGMRTLTSSDALYSQWQQALPGRVSLFTDLGRVTTAIPRFLQEHRPVVVMVARADSLGVDASLAALEWIRRSCSAARYEPEVMIAVNDCAATGGTQIKSVVRRAAAAAPTALIPFSRGLRSLPIGVDRLEKETAAALAQLTEMVCQFTDRKEQA